jgi:spore coat polysaccharide biosynthesis protein SpsF
MSTRRIVILVQARMGSSRLPGKVLRDVAGKPLVARVLERLERATKADAIVVATTDRASDDVLVEVVESFPRIGVFRGPEEDVLARFEAAARTHDADVVVRVTSDCPLIEPAVVDRCIEALLTSRPAADYAANGLRRTFPRGLDTEVFTFEALRAAHSEATSASDREHVTPYIYRHPRRFRLVSVEDDEDHSSLRWTVDTAEDLELVRRIYEALLPVDPAFEYRDVLALLDEHPTWSDINRHVPQKS